MLQTLVLSVTYKCPIKWKELGQPLKKDKLS